MTTFTGFKRVGFAVAALVLFVFGALGIVSLLIPADTVRDAVKAEIRAVTGLDPALRGNVSVSLFPSGSVTFSNVVLGNTDAPEPPLVAEQLTARLRFFPLLAGRIEVADVTLVNPVITLTVGGSDPSNWSALIGALTQALDPNTGRSDQTLPFSEIRLSGGTVTIRDETRKTSERLTNVDMSLAWPAISTSFAAAGHVTWRGEELDTSVSIADFVTALRGDKSGLKIRINGAPIKFAFDGTMSLRPTLKIEGMTTGDSPSLRNLLTWTGQKPFPGGGFGRFVFKSQTNVVGGTIALTSANVELDGNAAEGVLAFATDGRQVWQGTLAADALDLTPYLSTVRLLAANDREWSRVPLDLDGLAGFDLDLRLSAAKVTIGGAKLGRTAISGNLRGGKLAVTIGESQAFGGMIKGSFALAKSDQGAELKSQLQFTGVDMESCLGDLFGIRRLEGKGDLAFAFDADGPDILGFARSLNGTATLSGNAGAITGLNVEQLLKRLERRPLSAGSEFRTGRTPFEKLTVAIKVAKGAAKVDEVSLEGPSVRLALVGSASIPSRDLDLTGTASLIGTQTTEGQTTFELPFIVRGPWDDPIMLPDPKILIRRSGAAAPLLNALRDRRARDAATAAEKSSDGKASTPLAEPAPAVQPDDAGQPAAK